MKDLTGYQGPDYMDKDKETKPPGECEWYIIERKVGNTSKDITTVYVAFECDGEVLGSLRLPNPEYLRWLRERIQG